MSAGQERAATDVARVVLLAEVTGTGRDAFARYFANSPPVTTGYTRVRVQAAVARGDGDAADSSAVVHLVWAGADPAGTYQEDRTATVHLTREGSGPWAPTS